MPTFDELRKIYLFEHLPDDLLGRMLPFIHLRIFSEGSVIFNAGDPAQNFDMPQKGELLLEVEVSETVNISLGSVKPGYAFGWSSLFPGGAHRSSAVCVEPCEVMSILGEEFKRILDADHTIGHRVMEEIARIFKSRMERRTEQFVNTLRTHPDIQKIAGERG